MTSLPPRLLALFSIKISAGLLTPRLGLMTLAAICQLLLSGRLAVLSSMTALLLPLLWGSVPEDGFIGNGSSDREDNGGMRASVENSERSGQRPRW